MLTIVVPMAGSGSRFTQAGYKEPKPLVPIHGVPMVQLVINNLKPKRPHRFIFICQKQHLHAFDLEQKLKIWGGEGTIVATVAGLTEGAACTVLTVKDHINNGEPVMLANCDQYVDADINDYLAEMDNRHLDGMIMTLQSKDPKWSFAAIDENGLVTRVAEKEPISTNATVGFYNYRQGRDFVQAAEEMIAKNIRTKGEFYVAPVYNQAIARGKRIGIYDVGTEMNGMYGLGTPEDLAAFLKLPMSRQATATVK